jgi:hypothetical protein
MRLCEIVPCGRRHKGHGMCQMHLTRFKKHGDPYRSDTDGSKTKGVCSFPNCGRDKGSQGLCYTHYKQQAAGKPLVPVRELRDGCDIDDCTNKHYGGGLCRKHYWRKRKHGDPEAPLQRVDEKREHEKWCAGHGREGHWVAKTEFTKNSRLSEELSQYCRECKQFESLERRHSVTRDQYLKMFAEQGGVCRICGTDEPGAQGWHTDHDHTCCPGDKSCGECVRGLLCRNCNVGLGHFNDDPDRLLAAAAYLLSNSNIPTQKGSTAV